MGEICPKTKSYPLSLIKQKFFSTPPHLMLMLRLTHPPEKSLLPVIPSYLD